ncbi:DUF4288 domain-containing protein [Puniceicoccaceae bacterium K14]|nr:DUF4288 domain-containing protein [Puniceicoccaceae bacterium K14]
MSTKKYWFTTKAIFSVPNREELGNYLYEERVLLWNASSFDEAFKLASEEAKEYEKNAEGIRFLGRCDAYQIDHDLIGHGSELWSLQRGSNLEPYYYVKTFIDTEREVGDEMEDKAEDCTNIDFPGKI